MKVYYAGSNPFANHGALVCPAADPLGIKMGVCADWLDEKGEPKGLHVHFVNGVAEVPDELGKYLCATKMAKRTRLLMPRAA
jgi:hypothetical protein